MARRKRRSKRSRARRRIPKRLNTRRTKYKPMARRRYSRKRSRRRSSGGNNKTLMGLALTSTAESFIDPMIGNIGINISDDIVKLGLGWFLSRKSGYLRGVGYGLFAKGASNIVGGALSGTGLTNIFKSSNTTNGNGSNVVV